MDESATSEEYKLWKKNTPFLYDMAMTKALDWPSLTCQWFPDVESRSDKNYKVQRLLLGTHTNDEEPNYLQIAEVKLPSDRQDLDTRKYEELTNEIGGYGGFNDAHVKIVQKIVHDGEINRARYQFDNPNIVATKSRSGNVYIFDRTTHESFPRENEPFNPALTLRGHSKEGYGLAWNPHKSSSNLVISAGFDAKICQWDIAAANKEHRVLEPLRTYHGHTDSVEDIAWHMGQDSLFASVGDDMKLMIWDTRKKDTPIHHIRAHDAEVNCVDFNKENEWVLATGSGDKTAAIWDLRNLKYKLHTLKGHKEEVFQLSWSPHFESVLATSGSDRRVIIWDMARIGDVKDESLVGGDPPELMFMHGGHTSKISDIGWNLADPWTLASTSEDNIIQIWQMASNIYGQEDDKNEDIIMDE